ncbi:unnamed protein product [Aureobasidium mustum]|uniref:Uncharacterized protein n=1 Tax=Aureobasidium mustum TaxID=2773714 RepID=A0A9N8PIK4_9PEZI|nr:unnamed protein product [Aureobasidium mustum]
MPSDKKRKADEELPTLDQSRAASNSTTSLTSVFTVYSLIYDPGPDAHIQELLGVYTGCELANAAAHKYYNKRRGKVSIPDELEPEHEDLDDGGYRWLEEYEEENEDVKNARSVVRLRHDGGLRFGGRYEDEYINVVWVERRELNPSTLPEAR